MPSTVSAVSTKPDFHVDDDRPDLTSYTVSPSVRVRKEAFGLLFYNMKDSRLTFVKSGDLLRIKTLPHGVKRISAGVTPDSQTRVRKLLNHLLTKRLISDS